MMAHFFVTIYNFSGGERGCEDEKFVPTSIQPPAFPICLINHNTSTASSFNAARLTYYFCVSRELVIITPALFHFPYRVTYYYCFLKKLSSARSEVIEVKPYISRTETASGPVAKLCYCLPQVSTMHCTSISYIPVLFPRQSTP